MKEVLRYATSVLLIRIIGTLLGFVLSIIVARLFGAEGTGVYYLAIAVITIISTVGRIGFDNTIVRYISSYASEHEWGKVYGIYKVVVRIVFFSSLVSALILVMSASWLAVSVFEKPIMEKPFVIAALAVVPFSLAIIHSEALRGLKLLTSAQLTKTVLISLVTLVIVFPSATIFGLDGSIIAYTIACIVALISGRWFWSLGIRKIAGSGSYEQTIIPMQQLFMSSWPLFGVALTGLIMQYLATILLGAWGTIEDVGIFSVANRVANLLLFPLMAMISILAPKFSALYRQDNIEDLARLARNSSRLLMVFALPVALIVGFCSEFVLTFFGSSFSKGAVILQILLIGVVVNAVTGPVGNILMMSGYEYSVRKVMLVSAFVTIAVSIPLISFIGGLGAAITMVTGGIIQNVYMTLEVRRKMGFWPIGIGKLDK